jgi:hypothetical protein
VLIAPPHKVSCVMGKEQAQPMTIDDIDGARGGEHDIYSSAQATIPSVVQPN